MPREYTNEEILALMDLESHIQCIYRANSDDKRLAYMQNTIRELKHIAKLFDITPNWNEPYESEQPEGPSDIVIISVSTPQKLKFYQNFKIHIILKNTGQETWDNRIVMVDNPPNGPRADIAELPRTEPGGIAEFDIEADARGFEGEFTLDINIMQKVNNEWKPAYQTPIAIVPVHVTFQDNAI